MKKLSYIALAATLALGGVSFAAPAFAAPTGALSCNSGANDMDMTSAKHQLAQQLQLRTKGGAPTIDEWNGCLKVQYTDASGHNNVALYDPDSLKLVNQLS